MTNDSDSNRPVGLYDKYIQRIAEQRERGGLPPAGDIFDDEYWLQRQRNEALKQQPRDAA